jgi:hypothetical protein
MDPVLVWGEPVVPLVDAERAWVAGAGSAAREVRFVAAYWLKDKSFWLRSTVFCRFILRQISIKSNVHSGF